MIKLFSVLPRRNGKAEDNDAALEGYQIALAGVDLAALIEVVGQVIRGEVDGLSLKYCPTPPELSAAIRGRMKDTRRQIARETERKVTYEPTPFISVQMMIDAAKLRMADQGRVKIAEAESLDLAREMAKRGEVPPGSVYSALLGAFYSPTRGDDL